MRACLTSAVAIAAAVLLSFGSVSAQDCDACGGGGPHGCRLHARGGNGCHHGHRKYLEGKDRGANCGCNGSYNYPVPPLYTYHWPGMYKAVRMTDYHSPWRFPPIKPFTEEVLLPAPPARVTDDSIPDELQPISALIPITAYSPAAAGEPESMSAKLLKSFR